MNKSLSGSLDSPSGWDVPLFCQNQIGVCYNFPLVWFTFFKKKKRKKKKWKKISTYFIYQPVCTHAPTHTFACVCSSSELLTFSSRLMAIDICLLSGACSRFWSWWEWMMLLLEERKGGEEKGVWRSRAGWDRGGGRRRRRSLPLARPLESIWTPCAAERSRVFSCNMAVLLCHTACRFPSLSAAVMEEARCIALW